MYGKIRSSRERRKIIQVKVVKLDLIVQRKVLSKLFRLVFVEERILSNSISMSKIKKEALLQREKLRK